MSLPPSIFDAAVDHYLTLIQRTPDLLTEFESSLPQFFKAGIPAGDNPLEALASARRHLEWFIFERHSPSLRNRPAEALLEHWQESFTDWDTDLQQSLLESSSGIFEIVAVEAGVGAQAAELAGLQNFTLVSNDAQFEIGDLLVGRLYPAGEGNFEPSSACASIRDERLVAAVRRDIELIRERRERKVFRIAQEELEGMFFAGSQATESESPEPQSTGAVEAARDWLTGKGLAPDAIEGLLDDLREHAPAPDSVHVGRGDALAHWLDELAFSSQLDLGEAKSKLLAAWMEFHTTEAKSPTTELTQQTPEVDVDSAMAMFERDCASGKTVTDALGELEQRLDLDMEEAGDIGTVPDFPGVVGAMVEEFLWEEESEFGQASVAGFQVLHAFSTYSTNLGVFEELSHKDVSDFTTRWIPEHPSACEPSQAPLLLKALNKFCTWAHEKQGALALSDTSSLISELHGTLERILLINTRLNSKNDGDLYEVCSVEKDEVQLTGFDSSNDAHVANTGALDGLCEGDYLRAMTDSGALVPVRAYPSQLGALLKDLTEA